MAKLITLALLVFAFYRGGTPVYAENRPDFHQVVGFDGAFCDAPAPENFRTAGSASDLVVLEWTPAWAGAIQSLEVSVEEGGNWVSILVNPEVPGSSFILENLEPGHYKAAIATNCTSGEPGTQVSEIEFNFKVIDLTTEGRVPLSPVAVEDCGNIDYLNHEWVGFKVTEIATGESNLFEFRLDQGLKPFIKRVFYEHPIVAVDYHGVFPDETNPILEAPVPFRMDDFDDGEPGNVVNIGYVNCHNNNSPDILFLCKDDNNPIVPWKPEYTFVAMTAESVIDDSPPNGGSTDQSVEDSTDYRTLIAQNPFRDRLNVIVPKKIFGHGEPSATIRLFNLNGQVVLAFDFDLNTPRFSIPTESLLPGLYLFQIENSRTAQTLKVVKLE